MSVHNHKELLGVMAILEGWMEDCTSFPPLMLMVDVIAWKITKEHFPEETPETLAAAKAVLLDKLQYWKEKVAHSLDEEMVDILTGTHGKHF